MTTPARALAAVATFVITFLVGSATAFADTPASRDWPAPEPTSTLDTLLLFVGGTAALFVVISLFGLLTARNNYVPPPPSTDVETTDSHH